MSKTCSCQVKGTTFCHTIEKSKDVCSWFCTFTNYYRITGITLTWNSEEDYSQVSRLGDSPETVPFHKIFTPGYQVKLRYFSQCSQFHEMVQLGTHVYIAHQKYQVILNSSPWLSAANGTTITHRITVPSFISSNSINHLCLRPSWNSDKVG